MMFLLNFQGCQQCWTRQSQSRCLGLQSRRKCYWKVQKIRRHQRLARSSKIHQRNSTCISRETNPWSSWKCRDTTKGNLLFYFILLTRSVNQFRNYESLFLRNFEPKKTNFTSLACFLFCYCFSSETFWLIGHFFLNSVLKVLKFVIGSGEQEKFPCN